MLASTKVMRLLACKKTVQIIKRPKAHRIARIGNNMIVAQRAPWWRQKDAAESIKKAWSFFAFTKG
jgi:hypothetical protein